MGICKNDSALCRNTKVPGKVQFELVDSKHAPICNERSCDIVIILPDFVVVLPDFVVGSNKIMWTRQCTDNYCLLTLALWTTIFLLFGSSKMSAQKRQVRVRAGAWGCITLVSFFFPYKMLWKSCLHWLGSPWRCHTSRGRIRLGWINSLPLANPNIYARTDNTC